MGKVAFAHLIFLKSFMPQRRWLAWHNHMVSQCLAEYLGLFLLLVVGYTKGIGSLLRLSLGVAIILLPTTLSRPSHRTSQETRVGKDTSLLDGRSAKSHFKDNRIRSEWIIKAIFSASLLQSFVCYGYHVFWKHCIKIGQLLINFVW